MPRVDRRLIIAAAPFTFVLTMIVAAQFIASTPEWIKELLLAMLAAVTVHLVDHVWLLQSTEGLLIKQKNEFLATIKQDSDLLKKHIKEDAELNGRQIASLVSLSAMRDSNIGRIYASRREAATDIAASMTDPQNGTLRIIGVSLNDFVLGDDPGLRRSWAQIVDWVMNGRHGRPLDIKLLLIDPNSLGAKLRGLAEGRRNPDQTTHLALDLAAVTASLAQLVRHSEENHERLKVRIQCRLYRMPPILFLCLADHVCYVEQYHFWSRRVRTTPIPVIRYERAVELAGVSLEQQNYPMHREMQHHFDWIWDCASIDIEAFKTQTLPGVAVGMELCAAKNVFVSPDESLKRMIYLLENAKERIDVQGVSLNSFCRSGPLLLKIQEKVEQGKVPIRMLFLDPNCYQAKVRAFREHLLSVKDHTNIKLNEYIASDAEYKQSQLYTETTGAIRRMENFVNGEEERRQAGNLPAPMIEIAIYDSAPHSFIMRVDDSVLIEPYQFGKIVPERSRGAPAILGKDMPIIEFSKHHSSLFSMYSPDQLRSMELRMPFDLLEDHFDFVWQIAEKIKLAAR